MTAPLTPDEVFKHALDSIPSQVIEAVNELLVEKASPLRASVTIELEEVIARCKKKGITKQDLFHNQWLDFEPIFQNAGWSVTYEQPDYCEDYEAYWVFKAP